MRKVEVKYGPVQNYLKSNDNDFLIKILMNFECLKDVNFDIVESVVFKSISENYLLENNILSINIDYALDIFLNKLLIPSLNFSISAGFNPEDGEEIYVITHYKVRKNKSRKVENEIYYDKNMILNFAVFLLSKQK
jgi:hypothetical protein